MRRRGRRRRSALAATATGIGAVRAARREIAGNASDLGEEGGGLAAALFPNGRKLAIEAAAIAGLIALTAFLVYHFTTHTIANRRPLGGGNVAVAELQFNQSQMSFAAGAGSQLWGASNDLGAEVLDVYRSSDAGATWKRTDGPAVPGSCAQGSPSVASLPGGGELVAFLGAPECGQVQSLQPFLVVSARSGASGKWSPIVRVAKPAWKYGFDDGPALVAGPGRAYLAWERSLSVTDTTTVVASSTDGGKHWSAPIVVSKQLDHPHLVTAVTDGGTLYLAGIDAKLGLWASSSRDGGKTFSAPVSVGQLAANPASSCAQTAGQPLPREARSCEGADPTLLVQHGRLLLVYSDYGVNQTPNVYAIGLDRSLKPLFHVQVSPPDVGKTQQFVPAAGIDAKTGDAWACWYDSSFDPHARRLWFTCAASHDGRTWSAPVAAASQPSAAADIYGTIFGSGLRPSVVASGGVAHAFWGDSRRYQDEVDVETASIPASRAFGAKLVQP